MFTGTLDREAMLYAVPAKKLLGTNYDSEALFVPESHEQALVMMTKGEYSNKLYDIFPCHTRRLEAFATSGVVCWPFNPTKVKPVMCKKCLMLCDAY